VAKRVCESVYLVGGGGLSDPRDCLVYLLDLGELVLIDCGAGPGWPRIADHIHSIGRDPAEVHTLVLTHAHVDHIGAASQVKAVSGCRVVAHALDAPVVERPDPERTAASWYGLVLPAVEVDLVVEAPRHRLELRGGSVELIHTPGHTPGSLVALTDTPDGHRVLFGQDIHGPFHPAFDSDLPRWRRSMDELLGLGADILCEGHYGVFHGAEAVRSFIEEHLALNA